MLEIKEIGCRVVLEDAVVQLCFGGKSETEGKDVYSFYEKEHGITAAVTVETGNGVTACRVTADIENEALNENNNLSCNAPIQLAVTFEEIPARFCAAYQHRDWWSRPAFVRAYDEIPEKTQSLFLQGADRVGYILPMAGDKTKTYITKGTKSSLALEMSAYTTGINHMEDICFLLAEGENPYELTERVFEKACQIKKVPMKKDRRLPEMFEYFGWCSWDAFYTDITQEKVLEKVRELEEKHIPVRWLLMDDGWLSIKDQCLTSFQPEPEKFPEEFKAMTAKIKAETDIRWIGVWHALGGYWNGISPDSALAADPKAFLYRTKNGKLLPHFEPEKGFGFWTRWYSYLRDQGIDFVKVDGQSALKNYYKNNEEIGKAAAGAHMALDGAASVLMNGNIINCMGMAMENILSRPCSCVSRNSDDFVPQEEKGFLEHILENAYNGLYHDNVYVCDWDMFWTKHPDAKKHALVRAVSGGPVYVSDPIGETVYDEIKPLVYHDGRILRMDRCAKPAIDCIFHSPLETGVLKLTNTVHGTGAMAAFAVGGSSDGIEAELSPSGIYDLPGTVFGVYNHFTQTFRIIRREEYVRVTLEENGYALVLFVPLQKKITPIGLTDKYMSAHAVISFRETELQTCITLAEGGSFAFYKEEAPKRILANGREVTDRLTKENGFYQVDLSDYPEEVVVIME